MNSIYLIVASDHITISENINKILRDNKVDENCLIKYDMVDVDIDTAIRDLDTYNFLVNRKVVVCDNCYFLGNAKIKGSIEQNPDNLIKYLNNPSAENVLVLITDKIDERKNVVKVLKQKANVIVEEISIDKMIKGHLENFKMSDYVMNYFIDYCNNDNEKIMNELEKLKCYKADEVVIEKEDIDKVVIKSFKDNIFSLIDAIMTKKRNRAIDLYEELLENGEDINKIIVLLADQFRMIYNGKILLKEHHNNYNEVASLLGVHPYRFQKAINNSYNYSVKEVLKNLEKIDDMEIAIKTGRDTIAIFEMFIYNL